MNVLHFWPVVVIVWHKVQQPKSKCLWYSLRRTPGKVILTVPWNMNSLNVGGWGEALAILVTMLWSKWRVNLIQKHQPWLVAALLDSEQSSVLVILPSATRNLKKHTAWNMHSGNIMSPSVFFCIPCPGIPPQYMARRLNGNRYSSLNKLIFVLMSLSVAHLGS